MKFSNLKIQAAAVVAVAVASAAATLAAIWLVSTYFGTEVLFGLLMCSSVAYVLYCFYRIVLIRMEAQEKINNSGKV